MKISSIRELEKISNKISKILLPGDVIFLYGEIGVGKTTFSRLLINNLEDKKKVKKSEVLSPTFNIVFEYKVKEFTIKHFDLYRIKKINEIKNIGLFEDNDQFITLIEWPDLIKLKPSNRLDIFFKYEKGYNERTLVIKHYGRFTNHEF